MGIRRFILIIELISSFALPGLFSHGKVLAGEYRTILLTNDATLAEIAEARFGSALNIIPSAVDADYQSRKFTTDEGTRVLFSRLFHNKSLKGSKVLKTFADEYTADALALFWISYQSREPDITPMGCEKIK